MTINELHHQDPMARHILDNLTNWNMRGEWVAVNLTLKQGRQRDDGTLQMLDCGEVNKCIASLLKDLNKKVLKSAHRRHGQKVGVIPVVETKNGRRHVHMLIERPWYIKFDEYKATILELWKSKSWALEQNLIVPLATFDDVCRFTRYILKDVRSDNEVLDIFNMHLPWRKVKRCKKEMSDVRSKMDNAARRLPKFPMLAPDTTHKLSEFFTM